LCHSIAFGFWCVLFSLGVNILTILINCSGLLAAVVTQPIDCIKSQQQSMFRKVTISEAVGSILASDGYYGFFKGIRGRAKRVTFGVVVMSYINDKMQDWLTSE